MRYRDAANRSGLDPGSHIVSKATADKLLDLSDAAGRKRVFDHVHAWTEANPSLTGSLSEACDGVRRWVDNAGLGAQNLAEATGKLGPEASQGYIRSAGKTLDAVDGKGLERVKDSLESLKAVPKTGGVDDVVRQNLGGGIDTIEDFHALRNLDPDQLTTAQKAKLKAIRDAIPDPADGEWISKVVPPDQIDLYLNGTYAPITGGCIAKRSDIAHLSTTDELCVGLRLDYELPDGTKPFEAVSTVGVLEFPKTSSCGINKGYGPAFGGPDPSKYPYTGNGFLATRNGQALPEYHSGFNPDGTVKRFAIPHGAELYEVDQAGNKTLRGIYDAVNDEWVQ